MQHGVLHVGPYTGIKCGIGFGPGLWSLSTRYVAGAPNHEDSLVGGREDYIGCEYPGRVITSSIYMISITNVPSPQAEAEEWIMELIFAPPRLKAVQ